MIPIDKFWKVYAVSVFLLFTVAITYRFTRPANPAPSPTPTPAAKSSYPTAVPAPTLPVRQITPVSGLSPGVFYPYHQGVTINNPTPTIIGQIDQDLNHLYLPVSYGPAPNPVNPNETANFLNFVPGGISNLSVEIDGRKIAPVYAITRYPTILCQTHIPNGTPDEVIYTTKTDCLNNKAADIPPLIFFVKVTSPLSPGSHTLSVMGLRDKDYGSITFTVEPDYKLPSQSVFTLSNSTKYPYSLIATDSCAPGYYYSKNYLKFPLPAYSNPNLLYRLSLPQSAFIVSDPAPNQVRIAFGSAKFDLFFPPSGIFYEGKQVNNSTPKNYLSPFHELFLPLEMLVFPNGQSAKFFTESETDAAHNQTGYLDIVTIDTTGGSYPNSTIRFTTSAFSGCDG